MSRLPLDMTKGPIHRGEHDTLGSRLAPVIPTVVEESLTIVHGIIRDVSVRAGLAYSLDMTKSPANGPQRYRKSEIDRQSVRLFNPFLHFDQESNRFFAVNRAVIVAEREIHHRANNHGAIDRDGPLHDFVHSQNSALRRIQNRGAQKRPIHPAV